MGYACPVCEDPQTDDRHLANHLAFSAITGDDAHEAWLDEHVPDWGSMGETDLAPVVADYADEADYPQVFEDTTGDHDHDGGSDLPPGADRQGRRSLSDADRDVLAEARDLTREMLDEDADGDETQ